MNISNLSPQEIEETFVKTFIARDKRERWLDGLFSKKKRSRLLNRLPHVFDEDLDPRFAYDEEDLSPKVAAEVARLIERWTKDNPQQLCYIIAAQTSKDRQWIEWGKVRTDWDITFGAVIILIPDRLAYYFTERSNINKQPFYVLFHPTSNEHQSTSL